MYSIAWNTRKASLITFGLFFPGATFLIRKSKFLLFDGVGVFFQGATSIPDSRGGHSLFDSLKNGNEKLKSFYLRLL